MKTHKCAAPAAPAAPAALLTYEEIQEQEGIYLVSGYDHYYLVVLKYGSTTTMLFVDHDEIAPASGAWSTARFVKVYKKLYLEIR